MKLTQQNTIIMCILLVVGILIYIVIYKLYDRSDIIPSLLICIILYYFITRHYKLDNAFNSFIAANSADNLANLNEEINREKMVIDDIPNFLTYFGHKGLRTLLFAMKKCPVGFPTFDENS